METREPASQLSTAELSCPGDIQTALCRMLCESVSFQRGRRRAPGMLLCVAGWGAGGSGSSIPDPLGLARPQPLLGVFLLGRAPWVTRAGCWLGTCPLPASLSPGGPSTPQGGVRPQAPWGEDSSALWPIRAPPPCQVRPSHQAPPRKGRGRGPVPLNGPPRPGV